MRRALGLVDATAPGQAGEEDPSLTMADLNLGWADLIWLAQRGEQPSIRIADSLWLRDEVAFRQPFLDTNRDFFAAETNGLPADPDEAAAAINEWVEEHTAGRITDIVQPDAFSPQTVLALFNTVHLEVKWDHFVEDDTSTEPFILADGRQTDVPMMHAGDLEAPVVQTAEYDAVALSTDGPVTVWVVVPRAQPGLDTGLPDAEALLAGLDAERLGELYAAASVSTGHLALPRFTIEYEAKGLVEDLSAMGMPRAFSPEAAEFPGIADVGAERLFISEVVQKTFVDLNEQGVEAAAASGAIMDVTSAPVLGFDIRADRPFLFILTEEATQAPLFMGLVRDPR
jgi:serine protease inhibitor